MSAGTMELRRLGLAGLLGLSLLASAQVASSASTEKPPKSTRRPLTGNPQVDYLTDPNLPHVLIGYDLSNYPFYNRLPPDLLDGKFNFTCDGRHDGFYASIPHMCQVYHNCLFSQRYDFLCANYTVFDQKNFICHYASEVDCEGSEKHYSRNEELYKTTTTTTARPVTQIVYVDRPSPLGGGPSRIRPKHPRRPNFKRPGSKRGNARLTTTTPAPVYYDYDYYSDYYDQYYDYYDDVTTTTTTTQRPRRRPGRPRPGGRPRGRPGSRPDGIRERQRTRQGPNNNDDRSGPRGSRVQGSGAPRQQLPRGENVRGAQNQPNDQPSGGRRRRPGRPGSTAPKVGTRRKKPTTTTTTTEATQDYYYDDYYDYANDETNVSTTTTSAPARRTPVSHIRSSSRNRPATQDQAAAATEVGASSASGGDQRENTARVSVRRTPVSSRQPHYAPQTATETQTEAQRTRVGPRFPSRRPQVDEVEPLTTARDDGLGTSEVQPLVRGRPGGRLGRRTTTTPPPQDYIDYEY